MEHISDSQADLEACIAAYFYEATRNAAEALFVVAERSPINGGEVG